ncbi:MAG: TolB family protein [Planctomycetota bacterium]|jgi:hypothetical protein
MRTRGLLYPLAAMLVLLVGCDGPVGFATPAQQRLVATGRRITGNGDLTQPRFANGGGSHFLTVSGLDLDGFGTVFVLNSATLAFAVASQADTVLDQITGLPIQPLPDDDSGGGSPSHDGSFAAYLSEATNLLELRRTTFDRRHVYLRDLFGQVNELISVGASPGPGNETRLLLPEDTLGVPEANAPTLAAVLSGDGRFVVFASAATNLIPLAANGIAQIFVFDRDFRSLELLTRIAVGPDVFLGNGASVGPDITTTGRFVVYQSDASNLIPGDVNGRRDIFVFDRSERTTARLNIDPPGTGTLFDPGPPTISEDGTIVVFSARATPMGVRQIYVRNRTTGTTLLVSKDVTNDPGNDDSAAPALSPGGRFVAFQSDASDLVAGDTNGVTDIFVYDLVADRIARVSVNVASVQADGESLTPSLSADGRIIAFVSRALNLVPPSDSDPTPPSRTLDLYLFANPLAP